MNKSNLQRWLEQDAQRIEERIPMKLDEKSIDKVRLKLIEFLAEHDLTQTQVAKAIGVSSAKFSQFKKGEYPGDNKGMVNKLVNYMNSYASQLRNPTKKEFVSTTVVRKISRAIKQAEKFSDENEAAIAMIVGDAGHGKSRCLKEYARVNKNSVYIEADSTMTPTAIFSEICKAIRKDPSGSLRTLSRRLEKHLLERNLTVMIDEASSFNVNKLDQLRQVITVRCKCPLIISGNNYRKF